jgi:dihydroorotate dehydrogenase (fumarate)
VPSTAWKDNAIVTDLRTTYLGLHLASPLVPSASPLAYDLDIIRRMEDAGAAAIVLPFLFEEQVAEELDALLTHGTYSDADPGSYRPVFQSGPTEYLEHVGRAREAVDIPIIGSLNGVSRGGWTTCARALQQAGADALELNVYFLPTDPFLDSAEIEQEYVELLREVLAEVTIPVAVKLTPFVTNWLTCADVWTRPGRAGWSCSTASVSRTSTWTRWRSSRGRR